MNTADTSRPIRFFHRGAVVEVSHAAPTRSVLDWLREDARCSGTKEGCNEGDCGACTVVIGELAEPGEAGDARDTRHASAVRGLTLSTVNACIQFLPTLDGKALFTVEDLKAMNGDQLHPVQQAMVDCHGSQCGFCTPGFVMSLWSAYEHHAAGTAPPTRQQLADELSGNLCRCTGYRPILDAGQRMFDLPAVALDTAPVVAALRTLRGSGTFSYAAMNMPNTSGTPTSPDRFFAPRTLSELAALRAAMPQAQLLAGSTDVGLWVNKQFRPLGDIVYVGEVAEMKRITETDGASGASGMSGVNGGNRANVANGANVANRANAANGELYIGAGASIEAAFAALARHAPALTDVWLRFASPPIRHAGTMGGNVANGSPIGDSAPVLMALDAQIELRRGDSVRRMPLADFYVDYMKNQLQPGEFVQGLAVPLAAFQRTVRAYKISKRFDCDISALCAGFAIQLDGDTVQEVRLAYGGMAATVKRAARAEAALVGQPWSQSSVEVAKAALALDFKPLSDMRASAAYRLQVAQNLLQRLWLETRSENPLPIEATSVWSAMPHVSSASAAGFLSSSPLPLGEASSSFPLPLGEAPSSFPLPLGEG